MELRAEDGTPLEVKQGIVLAPEGTTHAQASHASTKSRPFVRSFSTSLPFPGILGALIFIPLALATGVAVVSIAIFVLAIFLILKTLSRLFSNSN
jgi:hypothetical protein